MYGNTEPRASQYNLYNFQGLLFHFTSTLGKAKWRSLKPFALTATWWPHKIVSEVLGKTGVEEVIPVRRDMMLRSQGTISFLSVQKGTGCY